MACCDWQTFEEAMLCAFARRGIPSLLIDWKRARRDWKRHNCTGEEAASMKARDLTREGEYIDTARALITRHSP